MIVDKAVRILLEYGSLGLAKRSISYLYRNGVRPLLPMVSEVHYAGIPVGLKRKIGDNLIPAFSSELMDIPDYEEALVTGLQALAARGDRVVVVGGGWGVTTAIAALAVGPQGSVVCFEGTSEGVKKVKRTATRNYVAESVTVLHAIVGESVNVYETVEKGPVVDPEELPECDILQLDCEGAEVVILKRMKIRPNFIIVETHGIYGASSKLVGQLMEDLGYEVRDYGLAEPRYASVCSERDIKVLVGSKSF